MSIASALRCFQLFSAHTQTVRQHHALTLEPREHSWVEGSQLPGIMAPSQHVTRCPTQLRYV